MSGAGIQGAGTTSAGFGTSEDAAVPGGVILRDVKTGRSFSDRKIDTFTRDYVLDEFGRLLGMNGVQHAIQVALSSELDSSAVKGLGQRLRSIDRITSNFDRQVLSILTEAVQPLIIMGLIEVLGFVQAKAGDDKNGLRRGAVYGKFLWRDLTTKIEHEEVI